MSEVSGEETTEVESESTEISNESTETSTEESKGEGEESSSSEESTESKEGEESSNEKQAPDAYADLTLPESMEVPPEILNNVHDWGRSLDLNQEQLQGAVDLHARVMEQFIEHQQEQWETTKAEWEKNVLADTFLHDENGKADAALATSKKAVLSIGGEDLMSALDITGAGSHPAVVKAFFELGQRIEAGSVNVRGMNTSEETKTGARSLYPSMKK